MMPHRAAMTPAAFLATTLSAVAEEAKPPEVSVYADASQTIFALIALALVLASALAIVFNWRPFVETFNARAVRPLIAFAASLGVVSNETIAANPTGLLLTALVIAGGSAGINTLLVGLGFREVKTPEMAPKPPPTKAWISVRAMGDGAFGDIAVHIGKDDNGSVPLVGMISGRSRTRPLSYFFADRGRFPRSGGFELNPAAGPYTIVVKNSDGATGSWGPEDLGAGAIVDVKIAIRPTLRA